MLELPEPNGEKPSMSQLNRAELCDYVNSKIVHFHQARLARIEKIKLREILRKKNPYLFRAKNVLKAGELIDGIMDAFLSSSEEKLFGDFLEELAIHISAQSCGGRKSPAQGLDLEFQRANKLYLVSIKSGPNWGNSSQQRKLEEDLRNAVVRVRQSKHGANIQSVLGICYGKTRTSYVRGYLKVVGQNFWYLISDNEALYTDIIEPIGHRAKQHNEAFLKGKSRVINRFTKLFIDRFCDDTGDIDWVQLVEFNSGNYDLDKFLS